jgi:hypothetical protein
VTHLPQIRLSPGQAGEGHANSFGTGETSLRRLGGRAELGFDISPRKDTNGPASGKWSAAGAEPAAGAIAPSRAKPDPLSAHNDLLRAQDASLYAQDRMYFEQDDSLYSKDGMYRDQDKSLYSEDGMYRGQDWSLYAQDGMYFEQDDSLYSEDRPYFGQDWSKFGGKKRVVSAANAC